MFLLTKLTLIVAGGVLGLAAGLIQGGIESGGFQKWVRGAWKNLRTLFHKKKSSNT